MLPELLLFGKARAGKDTVGQILAERHGAVTLSMADPMKRFAAHVFGFSEETLWGPSELRNKLCADFAVAAGDESVNGRWAEVLDKLTPGGKGDFALLWCQNVFSPVHGKDIFESGRLLEWFEDLRWKRASPDGISARTVLQTLGTEFGRKLDDGVWIRNARRTQKMLLYGGWKYDRTVGEIPAPGQTYDLAVVTDGRFRNEALDFAAGGARVIRVVDPEDAPLQAGVAGHQSEAEQDTVSDSWFDAVIYNNKADGMDALRDCVSIVMSGQPFSPATVKHSGIL